MAGAGPGSSSEAEVGEFRPGRPSVTRFKDGDRYDMCTICLDHFFPGETVSVLPCAHAFHNDCIGAWLTGYRRACPLCQLWVKPARSPLQQWRRAQRRRRRREAQREARRSARREARRRRRREQQQQQQEEEEEDDEQQHHRFRYRHHHRGHDEDSRRHYHRVQRQQHHRQQHQHGRSWLVTVVDHGLQSASSDSEREL